MDDLRPNVLRLLREGYGAEDIANILTTDKTTVNLKQVRTEIKNLRDDGFLVDLFDVKKRVTK